MFTEHLSRQNLRERRNVSEEAMCVRLEAYMKHSLGGVDHVTITSVNTSSVFFIQFHTSNMYKLSYADIKIQNIGLLARQAKSVLS